METTTTTTRVVPRNSTRERNREKATERVKNDITRDEPALPRPLKTLTCHRFPRCCYCRSRCHGGRTASVVPLQDFYYFLTVQRSILRKASQIEPKRAPSSKTSTRPSADKCCCHSLRGHSSSSCINTNINLLKQTY